MYQQPNCADCNTVKICNYDGTVLTNYRCQDVDPTKPYCVGAGICSSIPETRYVCNGSDDLCPLDAPGFYPDPSNCTRYIYCDSEMLSYGQNCLVANNVYNQTTASCFLKRRSSDCFQMDCSNSRNKDQWFVYSPYPQLYFFCSAKGPLMFKCARKTDVFDVNLKRCMFKCPSSGRFAHPSSNMYYECVNVSTSKIELFEQTCPSTLKFDEISQMCIPGFST
ncbi:uncharacterized protein LOC128725063 [Anopheles nili]|uniref:uncharacterized protein LOC128725063 n=1 Tax=Anopheles nili TaxID=185578 RepID=UPI00237BDE79|nr:uncharacterized protein LOC128725063 [Anopheles nili]